VDLLNECLYIYICLLYFVLLVVEADAEMGVYLVGCGGQPNSRGIIECDAAIMDGSGLRFGAVAALTGLVKSPNFQTVVILNNASDCWANVLLSDGLTG